MAEICSHLDQIDLQVKPSSTEGCSECLRTGGSWVHLRMCMTCGEVGCCNDSPNRHASKHAESSGHAIIRSREPGEDWFYCFEDDLTFAVES
jgi:uncharacterized UBP type Zn finger protein